MLSIDMLSNFIKNKKRFCSTYKFRIKTIFNNNIFFSYFNLIVNKIKKEKVINKIINFMNDLVIRVLMYKLQGSYENNYDLHFFDMAINK